MADHSGQELPYGHFGNPIYDPDENQWTFSRGLLPDSSISPFGEPEVLVQAPAVDLRSSGRAEKDWPVARRHSIQVRNLLHPIPELQPAANILPSLLRRSEAVKAASTGYDPCRGSLLAFGSIPSESHHVPISVLAFTSGVCSQELWLVERQLERRGWADTRCAWIDVPNLGCQKAYWCSNSGTIQEVRFSQTFDRAGATIENPSFMAVRCMTATTIFRPILRGCSNDDEFRPNTKLDLSPVFDVSLRETNDQMHADVAFNPWYSRQFAIISVAGEWDVWDLGSRRSHAHATANSRGLASKHRVPLTGDAWVRIMWISNPTTLLICTRNSLALYDISDAERVKVTSVDITSITAASYIVNVTLLPARPAYFCILTSTHLVVFHVQQMLGTAQNDVEVAMSLKLTHFWHQGDSSLKMSLLEIDELDTMILLYSGRTSAMVTFRICIEQDSCTLVTDPYLVNFASRTNGHTQFMDCVMIRVDTGDRGDRWKASIRGSFVTQMRKRNVHLFALTAFHLDGMVSQTLFNDFTRSSSLIRIPAPTWSAPRRLTSATELKKGTFIVDDSDEWEGSIGRESRLQNPDVRRKLSRCRTAVQETKLHGATNYEHVCRELNRQQSAHNELADRKLDLALGMLQGTEISESVPFKTFLELDPMGVMSVNNLKEVSARLEHMTNVGATKLPNVRHTSIDGEQTPLTVQPLARSHGLLEVYQHMIDDWISPLSTRIHGRLRISKDIMLRNTATEVALASRLLRADISDDANDNDLPRVEGVSSPILTSLSQPDSGLPTPSLTATPSVTIAPSVSTNQISTIYTSAEILRISKYTTFTPKSASTHVVSPLPRSLGNVLAHWSLGADPQEYDWVVSARRVLMQRHREDEEGMGEKEQVFARKKVERHIKRQRREAEEMERNRVQSSQATMVMSSQLPERRKATVGSRPMASSSQIRAEGGEELTTASQVVPGRFGGRPDHTPKKRKRKQGF